VGRVAPFLPAIVWLPAAKTSDAVNLCRLGARQVVTDDMNDSEISDCLRSAIGPEDSDGQSENSLEPAPITRLLVGRSWPMRIVSHTIQLVSAKRCTVLVTGETGTGKEMVARALHESSPRAPYPFVAVNCAALPADLLEAELFGHVRGAFTGAVNHRVGRFEQAHHGTLLLDEIGELPMGLQAKLLRVLQDREFQRVGSSETVKVDVRIVAASNADLPAKIRKGEFREDLYYRLRVVPISLPPLRQRREDIPLLTRHFVQKICAAEGIEPKDLTPGVLDLLIEYDWPGNVRQLENIVEMAIAMSGDRPALHASHFPILVNGIDDPVDPVPFPKTGIHFEAIVDRFERNLIEHALEASNRNKSLAAELLRLKRTTLYAKLRALGITVADAVEGSEPGTTNLAPLVHAAAAG